MATFIVIGVAGCIALRHLEATSETVIGGIAVEQWCDNP